LLSLTMIRPAAFGWNLIASIAKPAAVINAASTREKSHFEVPCHHIGFDATGALRSRPEREAKDLLVTGLQVIRRGGRNRHDSSVRVEHNPPGSGQKSAQNNPFGETRFPLDSVSDFGKSDVCHIYKISA
jgi:hypothetical protein